MEEFSEAGQMPLARAGGFIPLFFIQGVRVMRKTCVLVVSFFVLGMSHFTWAQNLIVNGGFENYTITGLPKDQLDIGGGFARFFGPPNTTSNTDITGWTIAGTTGGFANAVDVVFSNYYPSFAGTDSLDMSGQTPSAGVISQSFATVPGRTYNLSFEYSNNADDSVSATHSMAVSVTGNAALLNTTVTHSGATRANMNYILYSSNFVADSTSATLQFTSNTSTGYGIALDNVSVVPVPEPATLSLLGIAGMGLLGRRGWLSRGRRRAIERAVESC
jgi:choice-of-anchor C domain-containing protein